MNLLDIIKDYAFNKMQDNGLLLLPMPTGSGKTYTVHSFISMVLEEGKTDKIFFVTSLKKNINMEDLKSHFKKDHNLFDEKVLWIKSLKDCVIENFESVTTNYTTGFENYDEFKKLKSAIRFYNRNKENGNYVVKENVKNIEDSIKDTLEPNFRKKIKSVLKEKFKAEKKRSYSERLAYVKKKYPWLIELYPQILTKKKQVYLMSMDKFLLRNDTIIEKSEYIYKGLTEKAIIFIDEFDSTKKILLKRLIDSAIKTQIDYIEAFKQIHHTLIPENLPVDMTIASKRQKESKYGENGLREYLEKTQKRCNDIYDKYEMQLHFKLEDTGELSKTFLFQDLHSVIISNPKLKGQKLIFEKNNAKTQNMIKFRDEQDSDSKNFKAMLDEVRGFLKYFAGCVQTLAINYQEFKQENGFEDYSLDDSVKSYLDVFISDDAVKNYFTEEILLRRKNKEERRKSFFDGSFYENGFSYYSVEDDDEHSFTSSIRMTDMSSTPEKILADLCANARVFGISATSNIETCIGNYVLDYLKYKLGAKFFRFTSDEFEVLNQHFEKSINHYNRVKINVDKISQYDFPDNEIWEETQNLIRQKCDDFAEKRIKKTASVFEKFISNDSIKSMLCFINAFPNSEKFDEKILTKIFDDLSKERGNSLTYQDNVVVLRTDDFDTTKGKIIEKLSSGEKVLVLSTYNTVGAGQNLQYTIPDSISPVQINDFKSRREKDFDSIYLELPTYLFTKMEVGKLSSFVEYISQLEYVKKDGELSEAKAMNYIENAFKYFYYGESEPKLPSSNFVGYKKFVRLKIVQAIGRICRTNCKNDNIYIFYDEDLCSKIDGKIEETDLLNPEFRKLLEKFQDDAAVIDDNDTRIVNQAIMKSEEALNRIIKFVEQGRYGWKQDDMQHWQNIRHFVLQHPTLSENEFDQIDNLYKPFYLHLPDLNDKLWFQRISDYKDIDISFVRKENYEEVSAKAARLPNMLEIPFIKEMFETEKFATDFAANNYILCPPAFTNIYKGALGEYVGKEIFKKRFRIELEEITDYNLFELFDFKVVGKNIFVDFKNWSEYSDLLPTQDDQIPHIQEKLEKCGGDKALIINILADNKYKDKSGGKIFTIARLYDSENKKFDSDTINNIFNILH